MDETQLRRLPWSGWNGQPAYLSADSDSTWARLADELEASQVQSAEEVAEYARMLLETPRLTKRELAWALTRCVEALGDVLRVAESRGGRIPQGSADEPAGERL